jgi:hypothetical protein
MRWKDTLVIGTSRRLPRVRRVRYEYEGASSRLISPGCFVLIISSPLAYDSYGICGSAYQDVSCHLASGGDS